MEISANEIVELWQQGLITRREARKYLGFPETEESNGSGASGERKVGL